MTGHSGGGASRREVLRYLTTATAAIGLGAPLLTACGSSDVPGSLALAEDLDGASLNAVLRGSFIPALNDITVELAEQWRAERNASIEVVLSEEWRDLVSRIAQDRRGADLAQLFGNEPHVFSDRLVDVSELAESIGDSLGGWAQVARDTCVVDGVWRAIPWSTTRHALVVRTDILEDVGAELPLTYAQLLDVGTRLAEAGGPPLGITMSEDGPADSSALAYGLLWSFGAQEVDEAGVVALDSSETRDALEFFRQLSEVNLQASLNWSHPDNNEAYIAGEVAITQNPPSIYLRALEDAPEIAENTLHMPLPVGPAGSFQLPEINSLAVFRHSLEPIAAMDWIEFVNRREALVDRARESLAFHSPLVDGLDDDPEMPWRTDPRLEGLASGLAEGRMPGWPLPPSLEAALVYQNNSIVNMFNAVGSGDLTVSAAVSVATDQLRRVYET